MYYFKNFLVFTLSLCIMFSYVSCHDHEESNNSISIEFVTPTDGQSLTSKSNVNFHVKFSVDKELHKSTLVLREKGKNEVIFSTENHSHMKTSEIKETRDLSSFVSGTIFELYASSCYDHDCKKVEEKTISFSLGI